MKFQNTVVMSHIVAYFSAVNKALSASRITDQIRALPPEQRRKVLEDALRRSSAAERKAVERLLRRLQNPDIPEDFWERVEDIEDGRTVDMKVALNESYPSHLVQKLGLVAT